jgi:hypothetical protein
MAAEIISTVERRRSWPTEVKLRIMDEALAPGAGWQIFRDTQSPR